MAKKFEPLIWIDLEMTGLDPETCTILEIATVVTDQKLNIVATGPNFAIFQPNEIIDNMDEWNTTHHTDSGLLDRVRKSDIDLVEGEKRTLDFLKNFTRAKKSPLCGNSVGQDRRFLYQHMRGLNDYLHYRTIDVSSIKELVYRWYPRSFHPPRKKAAHLALDDILESIEELKFYRENIFVNPFKK